LSVFYKTQRDLKADSKSVVNLLGTDIRKGQLQLGQSPGRDNAYTLQKVPCAVGDLLHIICKRRRTTKEVSFGA
jgi:hypothetical protein